MKVTSHSINVSMQYSLNFFIFSLALCHSLLLPVVVTTKTMSPLHENWKLHKHISYFLGTVAVAVCLLPQCSVAKIDDTASIERFNKAYVELSDLDNNWNVIVSKTEESDGNGDAIRRRLGTVYKPPACEVALCSFSSFTQKFVNNNYDSIDIDKFEGISSEINEALTQADFLAYSAIFNEFSSAKKMDYIGETPVCST